MIWAEVSSCTGLILGQTLINLDKWVSDNLEFPIGLDAVLENGPVDTKAPEPLKIEKNHCSKTEAGHSIFVCW